MKHILILAFSFLLSFGLTSCDKDDPTVETPGTETPDTPDDNPDGNEDGQSGKFLIVYFRVQDTIILINGWKSDIQQESPVTLQI